MQPQRITLPTLCACGCGQATRITRRGRPNRFLIGHGTRKHADRPQYVIDAESGCWVWQWNLDGHGYGALRVDRRNVKAHRYMYERYVGPAPAGLDLDHLCHNADLSCPGGDTCRHRRCVNPSHLEPATRLANTLRGRGPTAANAEKDSCQNGHPFDEANTYLAKGARGRMQRTCRECHRVYERERRRRKQGRTR